jgi:hypothetical protein
MPIYPHTSAAVAAELVGFARNPEFVGPELEEKIRIEIERYACAAAGIIYTGPEAPLSINRLVWRRDDGWDHGGCAETWQDRAEELEKELKEEQDTVFSLLSLLAEIRVAAGDPEGKLMQDELVARIAKLK